MNDAEREIFLEQINRIRDEAVTLQTRLAGTPVAEVTARGYLQTILARCNAARGILQAKDWE